MNRFPPGPPGPPQRHAPPPYGAAPPGYGAQPPPGYGAPPGYRPPPRAPEALIPPSGTEASVASIVFALIGQSEKRIEAHAIEMEKLGAGLQHLRLECTETLSAIRPDPQRAYLFDSLLQDARGRAEEVKRTNLEQLIQQERDLQVSYQRILDEGLPMISGALDPNQGLPRGWEHQPPQRHVVAAPPERRGVEDMRRVPSQEPRRAAPPMPSPMPQQRRRPGPVVVQGQPPRGPAPAMPPPAASVTAAYSSAFKRAASKEAAPNEPKNETAESKMKFTANGPSAPSAPVIAPQDDSDSSAT